MFQKTRSLAVATVLVGASLGGCASVTSGTSQDISVVTPGVTGAQCSLTSPDGNYNVTTPGTLTVSKSKHDISVNCAKQGYHDGVAVIPSNFEGMTLGNILIGGIVGVGIDAASGAMNEYPNAVQVHMEKRSDPANEGTVDDNADNVAAAIPTS